MSENKNKIPLSNVFSQQNDKNINKIYIDIILEENIPVLCINIDTKKERLMPFKVLFDNNNNFWQQSGSWSYFLKNEDFELLKEKFIVKQGTWEGTVIQSENKEKPEKPVKPKPVIVQEEEVLEELEEVEVGYGKEYKSFSGMSSVQKVNRLNKNKNRLNALLTFKPKDSGVITTALVDTTKDAALINHVALEEAMRMGDDEAKKFTQDLITSTQEMVKTSTSLIMQDIFDNELMNKLVEKSNGTIVQHMTRVYLNGIIFIGYFNKLVSSSSIIQKLRITFPTKYRSYYKSLLPHVHEDDFDLERVFFGGMRAIAPELISKWALGFLIHDIGKASAVEYHEGEAAYNREIVIEHVKQGYKSIINKTNYPMEASLITGYHHEYYGDSDGYGYFRAYLQQYKKTNPFAKQDCIITYELEPMLDYQALAYFPAKILEIIDVYDSVTDPHRKYHKSLSPEAALIMMRDQFVLKKQKIDPILFDIFCMFIRDKEKRKS